LALRRKMSPRLSATFSSKQIAASLLKGLGMEKILRRKMDRDGGDKECE